MSFIGRLKMAFIAAYKSFREPALISDPAIESGEFGEFESRRLRYAISWSFYENDAYRKIHSWSTRYKTEYGLYRHIRNIYNPVYRDAEFWKAHLWGGSLDPLAGDGAEVPSALPILTDTESLRPAIAQLWRWSNWQTNKDVTVLYGTVLGDAAIAVVDDALRGKVYLKFLHPGKLSSIEMDSFNNVKAYRIQEERLDPTGKTRRVVYREDAFRDGDDDKPGDGYEEYDGMIFASATAKKKPQIVNETATERIVDDEDAFYSGCWARATLIAFHYKAKGNEGISFALQNLQKLKDDEPFSGGPSAEDEFDSVGTSEDEDEDLGF